MLEESPETSLTLVGECLKNTEKVLNEERPSGAKGTLGGFQKVQEKILKSTRRISNDLTEVRRLGLESVWKILSEFLKSSRKQPETFWTKPAEIHNDLLMTGRSKQRLSGECPKRDKDCQNITPRTLKACLETFWIKPSGLEKISRVCTKKLRKQLKTVHRILGAG